MEGHLQGHLLVVQSLSNVVRTLGTYSSVLPAHLAYFEATNGHDKHS